jgi:lipoprotein-anchoring transpeptidase ErfK/SrfK
MNKSRNLSGCLRCVAMAWCLLLATPGLASAKLINTKAAAQFPPGTIIIRAKLRVLYLTLDSTRAIQYPVAVPKADQAWSGYAHVNGKFFQPAWSPPSVVKRDHPELPDFIAGGAPNNPMGMAAITLDRSEIAIHGTTKKMRQSIGSAASYGCVRMYNEDVVDLYQRINIGALVVMME